MSCAREVVQTSCPSFNSFLAQQPPLFLSACAAPRAFRPCFHTKHLMWGAQRERALFVRDCGLVRSCTFTREHAVADGEYYPRAKGDFRIIAHGQVLQDGREDHPHRDVCTRPPSASRVSRPRNFSRPFRKLEA